MPKLSTCSFLLSMIDPLFQLLRIQWIPEVWTAGMQQSDASP